MRNRPDYGNATPEDLARALLRPLACIIPEAVESVTGGV